MKRRTRTRKTPLISPLGIAALVTEGMLSSFLADAVANAICDRLLEKPDFAVRERARLAQLAVLESRPAPPARVLFRIVSRLGRYSRASIALAGIVPYRAAQGAGGVPSGDDRFRRW